MFGIMLDLPEVELNLNSDSVIFSPGSSLQQAWVSRVHDFHIYRGRIQSKLPAQVFTDAGNLVCRGHITPRYTAGPDPYWVVLDTMGRRAYCIKSSEAMRKHTNMLQSVLLRYCSMSFKSSSVCEREESGVS